MSNLFSCCHQGWLVLLVQGRSPLPGSIRSTMFMLCCTDVAILPHIVETALLVRYSTKTFFYLLEFLSTTLTLSFRGQLCFVEVLLTPHIECLCLHPFQSKSSSRCYWFFDPYLFEHSYFCVCHCTLMDEFRYKSFAFLGHWSPELFLSLFGFWGGERFGWSLMELFTWRPMFWGRCTLDSILNTKTFQT